MCAASNKHCKAPWLKPPYRALVESANAAVFILQGTRYVYANAAAETMTGYSAEELCNMDFWEILHPDERDEVRLRALSRQHGDDVPANYPIRILQKNGSVRHTSYAASLIELDGRPAILGVSQDVTEMEVRRRQVEEQLRQAQKMEAIGTLVGGIAHDFNNILAGITGNVHLARVFAGDAEKSGAKLDRVEQLSFRAAGMIRQLLAFARKDMVRMQTIDVLAMVSELMARERMEIPRHIDLSFETGMVTGLYIEGDTSQLQQVLLNLVSNACAALEGVADPSIRVRTVLFAADDSFLQEHGNPAASEFVRLSVSDNGCGMDEETMCHMFEPFFTTRGVGSGSGLGLSMVYGAVQMHGGVLDVESEPGKGSTFHIFLPRHSAQRQPRSFVPDTELKLGKGECILYVDDDASVLTVGCEVLRSLGYKVLSADDGLMAAELFRAHADEIDLVLMDVVMPVLDGWQTAEQILKLRPETRGMFATGYDHAEILQGQQRPAGSDVLIKPYSVVDLSQAIRLKLDN